MGYANVDLDMDQDLDILGIVSHDSLFTGHRNLICFENLGTSEYLSHNIQTLGKYPRYHGAFDFDADNQKDILISRDVSNNSELGIFSNDGSFGFGNFESIYASNIGFIRHSKVADIDIDGDLDIIIPNLADTLVILMNTGNLNFIEEVVIPFGGGNFSWKYIEIQDLDGDFDLDIIISFSAPLAFDGKIGWIENLGSNTFGEFEVIEEGRRFLFKSGI